MFAEDGAHCEGCSCCVDDSYCVVELSEVAEVVVLLAQSGVEPLK